MMKKLFIISLVLLFIVLIFLGVYNFAFKKESKGEINAKSLNLLNDQVKAGTTTNAIDKIIALTDDQVLGPVYTKDKDSILYFRVQDGTIWQVDHNGKEKRQVTKTKINDIKSVKWSNDLKKILVGSIKDQQPSFYEYDRGNEILTELKKGLDNAIWDSIGVKIYYKYYDQLSKERTLNIANSNGSEWQKLADLSYKDISISSIPKTSLVSFWNSPRASEETDFQIAGASGEKPRKVLSGKYGADYLWSPNGTMALVSHIDLQTKKMALGIVELNGAYRDLGIPTFVSKAVWSSDGKTVYYALAGDIDYKSIMPDDYYSGKVNTKDTFWKIDITTGKKDRIIGLEYIKKDFDAMNLFLSNTEDALFFINKLDKKLYKIEF